jgi:short-subunit dehydrogenase involved in D-alanine esterification of teichoic acids
VKIKIADTFDMEEMTINFEAPVHLCHLAIPHIQGKPNATMWALAPLAAAVRNWFPLDLLFDRVHFASRSFNVTSGLAFVPLPSVPIYCATKGTYACVSVWMLRVSREHQHNSKPRLASLL